LNNRHHIRRAFTLVELLVVISIIGLLSTIAVASMNSARSRGRDARRAADVHQIMTAMQLYYQDNGTYPNPGTLGCASGAAQFYCLGLGDSGTCFPSGSYHGCTALDNAMAPYIGKIPVDPDRANVGYAGDAYMYNYSAGGWGGLNGPVLHWGMESVTNSSNCLGGIFGQWGATGRFHYYCGANLPQ